MHSLIAKWVSANQRDWDQLLSAVAFAYHTAVHETTGFMPYFLQDGRKARLPADPLYGDPPHATDDQHPFASALLDNLRTAFDCARENTDNAVRRRKDRYDIRTWPARYTLDLACGFSFQNASQ